MSNGRFNFKRAFYFELTLIVLFISTLLLYIGDVIPPQFRIEVLGFVAIIGLIPVGRSAFLSLKARKINVDLLATIALFFSWISTEWGSLLFINLMLTSARLLDLYTKKRVRSSLESLIKLKPTRARVLRDDKPVEIPLKEVRVGDLVIINLGEQIPVDGSVFSGSATVNQASLTGESVPVLREFGSKVLSATVVVSGNIIVRVERVGVETTFEKMIRLVEKAESEKTRMKTIAERFASWYIGIMLLVSIALYLVTHNTLLVLSVVLVVCADDIAIAIPLAYIASIGTAAKRGIIIKSADFLDQAAKITTLVVDKTGTLTLGKLAVMDVRAFDGSDRPHLLEIAGAICARSTHPVSVAIFEYAKMNGCTCKSPADFKEYEGRGTVGTDATGGKIIIGRAEFLSEQGVELNEEVRTVADADALAGNNVTLLAYKGQVVGLFALADELREGVAGAIKSLKKSGINEVVMLTGDNDGVAKNVADILGIDKYYSKLLPEHKVLVLKDYIRKSGRTVAMVGDGVNDAAVLTLADVGIAMGTIGTDAAIDSADIVLMQDDFSKIVELRVIAKKVLAVAKENFLIWGLVNGIGLYFVFTGVFNPSKAAAYNFLTDFIPIANSLRLFTYREKKVE